MQGVNYEELLNCTLEMDKIAQNMQELVDKFYAEVDGLQSKDIWAGQAAEHYVTESKKLQNSFEQARKQVIGYSRYLKQVVQNYKNIDKQIFEAISLDK